MGQIADMILSQLTPRVAGAMAEATGEHVAITREHLSTPYPPASSPHTEPHERKGYLKDGVEAHQSADSNSIAEVVTFSREGGNPSVPGFLEHGTPTMEPREYAKPMIDRVREDFLKRLARHIQL